jgi:hypothetical protein
MFFTRGGGAFYARVLRQMSLLRKIPPPPTNPQSSPRNLSYGIQYMDTVCIQNVKKLCACTRTPNMANVCL